MSEGEVGHMWMDGAVLQTKDYNPILFPHSFKKMTITPILSIHFVPGTGFRLFLTFSL